MSRGWKGNTERAAQTRPRGRPWLATTLGIIAGVALAHRGYAAGAAADQRMAERLQAQVAALRREADRIHDANAIEKLQRAFGYYLDKGYWDDAADLFTADAAMEVGVDGVYLGRARIRERLIREAGGSPGPGLPYGQLYHRMQLQPLIDVAADGKSAKGRWREIALLGHYHHDAQWGAGIYENEYVKQDGVWKIAKLHYYPNFVAPYEGGWAKLAPVSADWKSAVGRSFPADRPPTVVYRPFPDVFTPPFHYDCAKGCAASGVRAARRIGAVRSTVAGRIAREAADGPRAADESAMQIAQLDAAVVHTARTLARLESREAIARVQAAYGYYIDKGLWNRAAALFSDGATYEYGQRGVYVGRAHIRRGLELMGQRGLERGQLNDYPMLQPIIDVAPDNRTAKARWRSDVMLARNGKGEWGEGEYENEYVNEHGVWRLSKLHFYVTFFADYDKGWGSGDIALAGPSRTNPPDRPPTEVYHALPGVHVPPYHYSNPVSTATPMVDEQVHGPADQPAPLAALESSVNALAREVQRLADQAQIEKVQRAYGYYVDKAHWPDIAHLFAANGTYEIGGRGIFIGPQRVLQYLVTGLGPIGMSSRAGQLLNHQQFQGIVDVAPDGKTAHGRWTAIVMGGTAGGGIWGDCVYENTYVNDHGVWKFAHVRAAFTMYAPYKGGWIDHAVPNTRPDSFPPPPDLPPSHVYLTYPSFYVLPFHYPNPVTGRAAPPPNPAAGGTVPMSDYAK
ncbi:MAG: nuclear transport factor 2 family protein [Steroidobacteraceae bacterium]